MGTEQDRTQQEALVQSKHESGKPKTAAQAAREHTLLRYLSAEFDSKTRKREEPEER